MSANSWQFNNGAQRNLNAPWVLRLIKEFDVVPKEYFKKLKGTDQIWEVRVQYANNIFRILGFLDGNRFVILTNGFAKKSQKTPNIS